MKYGAGVSICTWTIRELPLCRSNYGFLGCIAIKHGSTGPHSGEVEGERKMVCVCVCARACVCVRVCVYVSVLPGGQ